MKSGLKSLYGSKVGKILPVLVIAGLVATASASVFVYYYGSATATIGTNDLALVAGPDSATCTTNFPCINVGVSTPADVATIAMNLGTDSTHSPQPQSFFTNPLQIKNNGGGSHNIEAISISSIASTHAADFGSITVYFCATQTDSPPTGCVGSFTFTSTTGGSVSGAFPVSIAAGASQYIEFSGYAGSGATNGDTITFNLQIQWA